MIIIMWMLFMIPTMLNMLIKIRLVGSALIVGFVSRSLKLSMCRCTATFHGFLFSDIFTLLRRSGISFMRFYIVADVHVYRNCPIKNKTWSNVDRKMFETEACYKLSLIRLQNSSHYYKTWKFSSEL